MGLGAGASGSVSVLVCRPSHLAAPLVAGLQADGFRVVTLPLIEAVDAPDGGEALDAQTDRLDSFQSVVFTSVNGVLAVAQSLGARPFPPALPCGAVGPATAHALVEHGFDLRPFVAEPHTAAALGATMPLDTEDPRSVFAPLAVLANGDLVEALVRRGVDVTRIDAYDTRAATVDPVDLELARSADVVAVTSPSIVARLVELIGVDRCPPVVAIGPRTAAQARVAGLAVVAVAEEHSNDGLRTALAHWCFPDFGG